MVHKLPSQLDGRRLSHIICLTGTLCPTEMAAAGSRLADSFSPLVDRKNPEVENFSSSAGYLEACALTRCSKSKPVTVDNLPKLMLNRDKLKLHCRNSVHPTARKRLWLDVVGVQDMDSVLLVKTLGEPREGQCTGAGSREVGGGGGGGRGRGEVPYKAFGCHQQ